MEVHSGMRSLLEPVFLLAGGRFKNAHERPLRENGLGAAMGIENRIDDRDTGDRFDGPFVFSVIFIKMGNILIQDSSQPNLIHFFPNPPTLLSPGKFTVAESFRHSLFFKSVDFSNALFRTADDKLVDLDTVFSNNLLTQIGFARKTRRVRVRRKPNQIFASQLFNQCPKRRQLHNRFFAPLPSRGGNHIKIAHP